MRNLKRALSLALALVMVMSMMVVGAGAVSIDDFTDADEIVNTEAVTTMVSLGVIDGNDDGSYNPTGVVKRGEMAKLIAVMLNGGKDPTLGATPVVFADTAGHWAQNYISYVANLHIIDGRGDGTFGPNDDVTGSEAAKMLLTALGYRSDLEGFTGANWAINVQAMANQINLFDGLTINPDEGLTRDDTAQMLYNAVQCDMVEYRNLEGSYDGIVYPQPINGVNNNSTVLWVRFEVEKVEGVVVANDIMDIDGEGTTVSGKVRLNDVYVGGVHRVDTLEDGTRHLISDVYPVALDNSYLGQRVVLYVKGLRNLAPNAASTEVIGTPILSEDNTVVTTGSRMSDADAVRTFLSANGLSIPTGGVDGSQVDGTVTYTKDETVRGGDFTRDFAATGSVKDAGTEFTFIDHDGDGVVDYIFKTLPTMAKVTVYNESDETMTIAGLGAVDFDEVANEEDVALDDIVLYYLMNDTYYVSVAETVSGEVESYNNENRTLTIDGTAYGQSDVRAELSGTDLTNLTIATDADEGMDFVGGTYTLYLDKYGNAVAWVLGEGVLGNYALVLNSDVTGSAGFENARIKLLLSDGSEVTGSVNLLASANRFGMDGTSSAKESNMAHWLDDDANNATAAEWPASGADTREGLNNTLVSYVIGDNGSITIGSPVYGSNYGVATGTSTEDVGRSTASYTLTRTDDPDGQTGNASFKVTDNTLFFIRNANGDGNTYGVIQGVSNLPDWIYTTDGGSTRAKAESIVYTTTDANPDVARAVFVDGYYEGAANYVYVVESYTGTTTVNGERVYTYPVVFENGEAGELNVDRANVTKEMVYEYTTNSSGVASLDLTENVVNGVVSTYARGSNLTLANGDGLAWGADTDSDGNLDKNDNDGDNAVDCPASLTLAYGAQIWNVEGDPYATTLTSDLSVAVVLNSDGLVQTAFVTDTSVTKADIVIGSGVNGLTPQAYTVYSGYSAVIDATGTGSISYTVHYGNTNRTGSGTANITNGQATISVPKNADRITIDSRSSNPTSGSATIGVDANTAAAGGTITVNGTNVAMALANNTGSGVLTMTKSASQTVAVGGADAADVTVGGTATDPTFTVDTSDIQTTGGTKTFTLTLSETGYVDVTYTVTVTVAAATASNVDTLASVLGVTISPATAGTGTSGSPEAVSVELTTGHGKTEIAVADIVATDTNASVTFYGSDSTFASEEAGTVALSDLSGAGTTVYAVVTAEDGTTMAYYAITITEAAAAASDVDTLASVLGVTISPATAGTGTSGSPEAVSVELTTGHGKTEIAVADIVATDTNASVTFYGSDSTFASEEAGTVALSDLSGAGTTVYAVVTAEDGTTMAYYAITITEAAAAASDVDTLASVLGVTISPATAGTGTSGSPEAVSVELTTGHGKTEIAVADIVATDTNASVTFYGSDSTFASEEAGTVALSDLSGAGTTVYAVVTAEDGTTMAYYAITITEAAAAASDVDTLASVLGVTISPATAGTGTSGSPEAVSVELTTGHGKTEIAVADIVATDTNASVTFYGSDSTFASEEAGTVALSDLSGAGTTVYAVVTAEDGTTMAYYAITITEA